MNTRALLEGALLVSLSIVMTAISLVFPFLGNIILLLTPLPYIILAVRWNSQLSILASIVSTVILMFLFGPEFLLLSLFFSGLIGVAMGAAFEEGFSPQVVMVVGTVAVLVSFALNLAITVYIFEVDILNQLTSSLNFSGELYRQLGISQETVDQVVSELFKLIKNTYLVLFLCGGLLTASFNYHFSVKVLDKIGDFDYPGLDFLQSFKLPRILIIIYLISFFFSGVIWQNIYILGTFLLMSEGGVVVIYFQNKINNFLLLLGVLFLPVFLQVLLFVGIADVLFDFRKLEKEEA